MVSSQGALPSPITELDLTAKKWAQYSIYLPVHYRRIKSLLFLDGTPFWDFFAA